MILRIKPQQFICALLNTVNILSAYAILNTLRNFHLLEAGFCPFVIGVKLKDAIKLSSSARPVLLFQAFICIVTVRPPTPTN